MKDLNTLNKYRQWDLERMHYGCNGDKDNGVFKVRIKGKRYMIVASAGGGWEHVSVSPYGSSNVPPWEVMCAVKDMFFYPEECVVQYHPKKSEYINLATNVLHLWRPTDSEMPTPPLIYV